MKSDEIDNNIHKAYCAVSRTACDEQKVVGEGIRDAAVQQVFFYLQLIFLGSCLENFSYLNSQPNN